MYMLVSFCTINVSLNTYVVEVVYIYCAAAEKLKILKSISCSCWFYSCHHPGLIYHPPPPLLDVAVPHLFLFSSIFTTRTIHLHVTTIQDLGGTRLSSNMAPFTLPPSQDLAPSLAPLGQGTGPCH